MWMKTNKTLLSKSSSDGKVPNIERTDNIEILELAWTVRNELGPVVDRIFDDR